MRSGCVMKNVFYKLAVGVMLISSLGLAGLAQSNSASQEKPKKEKAQVVAVEKKNREKPDSNSESQKPRGGTRN
jgi:CHASE1-domain containing sensor protein